MLKFCASVLATVLLYGAASLSGMQTTRPAVHAAITAHNAALAAALKD